MTHTAQDLLAAVGVDWTQDDTMHTWDNGITSTQIYTGPALGTPELDAVLWVEGQREMMRVDTITFYASVGEKLLNRDSRLEGAITRANCGFGMLFAKPNPGHALAAAIAEVKG